MYETYFTTCTNILWKTEVKTTSLCNAFNNLRIILYSLVSEIVFPSIPCALLKLIYGTRIRKEEDITEVKFSLE